jgi:hypothetical protein
MECYPQAQFIVFDNGSKFKLDFKKKQMWMQHNNGIKSKPTIQVTSITLQANTITEQLLKVVNDMLRSLDLENNYENLGEQQDNLYD